MDITAKKIIIDFLIEKRKIINKLTNTNIYLYDDDINDIINLTENDCIKILRLLFKSRRKISILDHLFFRNSEICPHCILYINECEICKYAYRHNKCSVSNIDNDFGKIIKIIKENYNIETLYRIEEIKKLCDKTIKIRNDFLKIKIFKMNRLA